MSHQELRAFPRTAALGEAGSGRHQPRRGKVTPGKPRHARTALPGLSPQLRAARTATPHAPVPEARAEPRRKTPRRRKRSSARHGMARPAAPNRPAPPASLPRSRDDCRCPRSGAGGGRARGAASHPQCGCRCRREARRDRRPTPGRRLPSGPAPPPPLGRARPSTPPVDAQRSSLRGAAP